MHWPQILHLGPREAIPARDDVRSSRRSLGSSRYADAHRGREVQERPTHARLPSEFVGTGGIPLPSPFGENLVDMSCMFHKIWLWAAFDSGVSHIFASCWRFQQTILSMHWTSRQSGPRPRRLRHASFKRSRITSISGGASWPTESGGSFLVGWTTSTSSGSIFCSISPSSLVSSNRCVAKQLSEPRPDSSKQYYLNNLFSRSLDVLKHIVVDDVLFQGKAKSSKKWTADFVHSICFTTSLLFGEMHS